MVTPPSCQLSALRSEAEVERRQSRRAIPAIWRRDGRARTSPVDCWEIGIIKKRDLKIPRYELQRGRVRKITGTGALKSIAGLVRRSKIIKIAPLGTDEPGGGPLN